MQCKDIPNGLFLEAVRSAQGPATVVTRWHVHAVLESLLGPVPEKIILAKAKKLIRAGKLDGCACGCRGDFQIPAPPVVQGHGIWVQRLLDQANGRIAP